MQSLGCGDVRRRHIDQSERCVAHRAEQVRDRATAAAIVRFEGAVDAECLGHACELERAGDAAAATYIDVQRIDRLRSDEVRCVRERVWSGGAVEYRRVEARSECVQRFRLRRGERVDEPEIIVRVECAADSQCIGRSMTAAAVVGEDEVFTSRGAEKLREYEAFLDRLQKAVQPTRTASRTCSTATSIEVVGVPSAIYGTRSRKPPMTR